MGNMLRFSQRATVLLALSVLSGCLQQNGGSGSGSGVDAGSGDAPTDGLGASGSRSGGTGGAGSASSSGASASRSLSASSPSQAKVSIQNAARLVSNPAPSPTPSPSPTPALEHSSSANMWRSGHSAYTLTTLSRDAIRQASVVTAPPAGGASLSIAGLGKAASTLNGAARNARIDPNYRPLNFCLTGRGVACGEEMMADPRYKQILIMGTGYTTSSPDQQKFYTDVMAAFNQMNAPSVLNSFTRLYQDNLIYVFRWTPGGSLGSATAAFRGAVMPHPTRGWGIRLSNSDVVKTVKDLQVSEPNLIRPLSVFVIFNTDHWDAAGPASMSQAIGEPYGIAKIASATLTDPRVVSAGYSWGEIPVHENMHSAFQFGDEYFEPSFADTDLQSLDPSVTPFLLMLTGSGNYGGFGGFIENLFGVYEMRFSEILVGGGYDNLDVTRFASRVRTPGFTPRVFDAEGGMYFGRGVFSDTPNNIMKGQVGFTSHTGTSAFELTSSQHQEIDALFRGAPAPRPNDRIRTVGPVGFFSLQWTDQTRLMLFDADKHNPFHPTQYYDVQLGWYDGPNWVTMQRRYSAERRTLDLRIAAGLVNSIKNTLCDLGFGETMFGTMAVNLCQTDAADLINGIIPVFTLVLPYQDVMVTTPAGFRHYTWRFRTFNGTHHSEWTAWSPGFDRAI